MRVAVSSHLRDEPGLLEQVRLNRCPGYCDRVTLAQKVELGELAETRRVVVSHCLCIPKRLEDRGGLHHEEVGDGQIHQ
jgi:hypothetical protein